MGTQVLLIEPVWNRNLSLCAIRTSAACLLIEPVWNRNQMPRPRYRSPMPLLIEPVWNRNGVADVDAKGFRVETFNRTSMESKLWIEYP